MAEIRAGLVVLSAGWFMEIGFQDQPQGKTQEDVLSRILREETEKISNTLGSYFEVIFPGIVFDAKSADKALRMFADRHIDCVVIVHAMWNEDPPLVRVLKGIRHLPVVLWSYSPEESFVNPMDPHQLFRISGTVGMLQGSTAYRDLGIDFHFLFGHSGDEKLNNDLKAVSAGLSIKKKITRLRIGRIGPRCEDMVGTYVDELRLRLELGPEIVPISIHRLYEVSRKIPEGRVKGLVDHLRGSYSIKGVSDESLDAAARVSLGVEDLAREENLGALAIQDLDPELHTLCGTRPGLWTPGMSELGLVAAAEADVLSALGLWIIKEAGGETPMYTEIFSYDQKENALLVGHAGFNDPVLAGDNDIIIIPDLEYEKADRFEGAWLNFTARPGRAEMFNLSAGNEGYRLFNFSGNVVRPKIKLDGWAHAYVEVMFSLPAFFEKVVRLGMMQHYAVTYSTGIAEKIKLVCSVLGVRYIKME
jgi:L-arabinose isomerase